MKPSGKQHRQYVIIVFTIIACTIAESFFFEEKCLVRVVCVSTMSANSCADDVGASYTAHDEAHDAFMTLPLYTRTIHFGMNLVVFVEEG